MFCVSNWKSQVGNFVGLLKRQWPRKGETDAASGDRRGVWRPDLYMYPSKHTINRRAIELSDTARRGERERDVPFFLLIYSLFIEPRRSRRTRREGILNIEY